jgi:protein TonB
MAPSYDFNDDEPSFLERYRIIIGVVVVLLIAGAVAFVFSLLSGQPSKPPEEIAIHLLPPPPTPPPPPPPPPPKLPPPPEQKMVEQPPLKPNEVKPKDEPKSPDKPPGPPGPPASGPPSDFGLGGGGGEGNGLGGGGGGGSRFGYYANEVVSKITDAIHNNDKTRDASAHVKVRIWVDGTGRITRAKLAESSDDPSVDAAIENQVLDGLTLPEAPPSDMPMPIVLVLTETRPN